MKKLNREELKSILQDIGNSVIHESTIVLCGGANIILTSNHRDSTNDIDYLYADSWVEENARKVCAQRGYPTDTINNDVRVTLSYSERLFDYASRYLIFGRLKVNILQDIALLCMKLKSFRGDSSDYEDCLFLIERCKEKGITIEDIHSSLKDIYPLSPEISVDAERLLADKFEKENYQLDNDSLESYAEMLRSGFITEDELPSEFKPQITQYMNNQNTNTMLANAIRSLNS